MFDYVLSVMWVHNWEPQINTFKWLDMCVVWWRFIWVKAHNNLDVWICAKSIVVSGMETPKNHN